MQEQHLPPIRVENLGTIDYATAYQRMLDYTDQRQKQSRNIQNKNSNQHNFPDVIWLCEHLPVYTQGLAGKAEHIFNAGDIPVVQTNRGGQATYHAPGQIVAYPLLDLKARGFFVKELVYRLESAAIATLKHFAITGLRVPGAPGVYVRPDSPQEHDGLPSSLKTHPKPPQTLGLAKIAALGIKVSRGYSYHGIALNVDMDTQPYANINPCGYTGLQTVDLRGIGVDVQPDHVRDVFAQKLVAFLG